MRKIKMFLAKIVVSLLSFYGSEILPSGAYIEIVKSLKSNEARINSLEIQMKILSDTLGDYTDKQDERQKKEMANTVALKQWIGWGEVNNETVN